MKVPVEKSASMDDPFLKMNPPERRPGVKARIVLRATDATFLKSVAESAAVSDFLRRLAKDRLEELEGDRQSPIGNSQGGRA